MLFKLLRIIFFLAAALLSFGRATADSLSQNSTSHKTVLGGASFKPHSIQNEIGFLRAMQNNQYAFSMESSDRSVVFPENSSSPSYEGCSVSSGTSPNIPFYTFWSAIILYVGWLRIKRKL